jgi:hypothetical protein
MEDDSGMHEAMQVDLPVAVPTAPVQIETAVSVQFETGIAVAGTDVILNAVPAAAIPPPEVAPITATQVFAQLYVRLVIGTMEKARELR